MIARQEDPWKFAEARERRIDTDDGVGPVDVEAANSAFEMETELGPLAVPRGDPQEGRW
jgi:hypothetical protein